MDIKIVEKTAKKVLRQTKHHAPQLILINDKNEVTLLIPEYSDDKEKEEMLYWLRIYIAKKNIIKYFFVTEGYMSKNINIRPKNDPKAKKTLIILEFRKDGTGQSIIYEFHKENNQIIFGEKSTGKDFVVQHSRWNFYLEDVMDEVIRKEQREKNEKK